MKNILSLLVALLLAACSSAPPPSPHGGGAAHVPGGEAPAKKEPSRKLTVTDRSDASEIAFIIKEGEQVFTDYGVSHTKEMHLILVRNDLQHFSHLHPVRDKEEVWRIKYSAPAGGRYWLYADFVDTKDEPFTIRFERRYAGEVGLQGLTKDLTMEKNAGDYRVKLDPSVAGNEVSFTYTLTDPEGKHPVLEEYLGAKGHSVLIAPSGDFIHTHPSGEEGEKVTFTTSLPPEPFYRIFTQFQIEGNVLTVSFDFENAK